MERYGSWLSHAVRGDFGKSYYWHDSVSQLVANHAPPTIRLALMAVVITVLLAIPLGVAAALRPNSALNRFSLGVAVSAPAIRTFWLGPVRVVLFRVLITLLPLD